MIDHQAEIIADDLESVLHTEGTDAADEYFDALRILNGASGVPLMARVMLVLLRRFGAPDNKQEEHELLIALYEAAIRRFDGQKES
jgi:hypothetical protein